MARSKKMVGSRDLVTVVKTYKALTNTIWAINKLAKRTQTSNSVYDSITGNWSRTEQFETGNLKIEVTTQTLGYSGRLCNILMTISLSGVVLLREEVVYGGK